MKRFLLAGAAMMALLSCSKDIIKEVHRGAAIEFTVAAHTRAQETTTSNLQAFYVTAVDPGQENNYFTDIICEKSGEYYTSNPTYYWPGDGTKLDFYAYTPSAEALGVVQTENADKSVLSTELTINNQEATLTNFSPNQDISQQVDFMTATWFSQGKPTTNSSVPLDFQHRLAQVKINAKNCNPDYSYSIKGIRIADVASAGTFDFKTNEWTLLTKDDEVIKITYEVTYENNPILLSDSAVSLMGAEGSNAMLLPQQLNASESYLSVLVKQTDLSSANETEYTWLDVPVDTEWTSGNRYVYILDFSTITDGIPDMEEGDDEIGNDITFDVAIEEWNTSDSDPNQDLYPSDIHPLVGIWDLESATVQIEGTVLGKYTIEQIKADEEGTQAVPEQSYRISFVSHDTFYLDGDPTTYHAYVGDDGNTYLTSAQGDGVFAKLVSYDEETLVAMFYWGEGEELSSITLNYKKNENDGWENSDSADLSFMGLWELNGIYLAGYKKVEGQWIITGEEIQHNITGAQYLNFVTPDTFTILGADEPIWLEIDNAGNVLGLKEILAESLNEDALVLGNISKISHNEISLSVYLTDNVKDCIQIVLHYIRPTEGWQELIVGKWSICGLKEFFKYEDTGEVELISEYLSDNDNNQIYQRVDQQFHELNFETCDNFYFYGIDDRQSISISSDGKPILLQNPELKIYYYINEIKKNTMNVSVTYDDTITDKQGSERKGKSTLILYYEKVDRNE